MTAARPGRRPRLALLLAASLLGLLPLATAATGAAPHLAAADGFAGPGFIGAPGGPFMTDAFGRRLQLHGFNLVAKCPADSTPSTEAGTPCLPPGTGDPLAETNYYLDPAAADPDRRFTDADAGAMADLGYNIARVGIIWRGLEPGVADPSVNKVDNATYCAAVAGGAFPDLGAADPYDQAALDAYLAHIDVTVNTLSAHGIYSMIDMHQDAWNEHFHNDSGATPWEGEGAPEWATCTAGVLPGSSTSSMDGSWNSGYTHNPAMANAYDHFWKNDVAADLQGQFLKVWRAIAEHYAGNPWVIGYDPYNEPYDSYNTPTPVFDARLQCFYAGAALGATACTVGNVPNPGAGFLPTIEEVDTNHLVFYEQSITTDFGQPVFVGGPALGKLPFDRLVMNFHDYGLVGAFLAGAMGTPGECTTPDCASNEMATSIQFDVGRQMTQTNQPGGPAWFLSEFGAEDYGPDLENVTRIADSSPLTGTPVSWTYWAALQNHDPTGDPHERLFDSDRNLIQPKAGILTRAYPRATAGTPTAGSQVFDPATASFDFSYSPDASIAAPTEVVVPPLHYGAGYAVRVSGATVTSACGANPVTLVADPGATTVDFHVEPAGGCDAAFVTPVCNPANPPGPNNPCPVAGGLPDTSRDFPVPGAGPAVPVGLALIAGAGVALRGVARLRRRRRRPVVRHH
ncbi:MAG: endoglycosylceramidase [Chloroflexota bacterium]|nr:endoglycosylceramidase [Chloroflexota bacterium]